MAAYRYWRLYITRWNYNGTPSTGTGDVRVAEWEFYDGSNTKWPGASPTASVLNQSLGGAAAVFDGNLSDSGRCISDLNPGQPWWVKVDLGSVVDIKRVKIAPDGAASIGYHLLDFEIQGSSTGAFTGEQDVVVSFVGVTGWANNTLKEFPVITVSGTVLDDTGSAAARTVRSYDRSTGALIAEVTSDSGTGAYRIPGAASGETQVIVLDDSGGTVHEDLIGRATAA